MRDQQRLGLRHVALGGAREPGEIALEPLRVELLRPADDDLVERRALALEVLPALDHGRRVGNARRLRPRCAGEPAHPYLVGPQQMAERAVDRAEEGAALLRALLIAQLAGRAVEVLVLPAVVGRHLAYVSGGDHADLKLCASRAISCRTTSSTLPSAMAMAPSISIRSVRSVGPQVRRTSGVSRRKTSPASLRSCTSQRARANSASACSGVAPKRLVISPAIAVRSRSVMPPSDCAIATIMAAAASRASSIVSSGCLACFLRQLQRRNMPRASLATSAISRAALASCCVRKR